MSTTAVSSMAIPPAGSVPRLRAEGLTVRKCLTAGLLTLCAPAQAQVVWDCAPDLAQARNIAEPWEQNTLTLAGGEVRLAVIDAVEPGAVPFHLMVLTPPYDEHGVRRCHLVSATADVFGFSALTLDGILVRDLSDGTLDLELRAGIWNDDEASVGPARLHLSLDPVLGNLSARLE